MNISDEQYTALEACLLNANGSIPLHARFRALFTLKSIGDKRSISIISQGFSDESALLKHEFAYVLGQMHNPIAVPILEHVLSKEDEDPMVRHEAAEALGAIGDPSAIELLNKYLSDSERVVRETCELALARIQWSQSSEGKNATTDSKYTSIDPAPSLSAASSLVAGKQTDQESVTTLRALLLDPSKPLFERYRAMFSLRNIGSDDAVEALAAGFTDSSALFRHEIAFVFGQLLSPYSVRFLLPVLQDPEEESMVRHEAAEALGAIATPEVLPHLQEWMSRDDAPRVVRESCAVAVDMWEHENSGEFQYANSLVQLPASA